MFYLKKHNNIDSYNFAIIVVHVVYNLFLLIK